jgi:hypothetical protein
VFNLLRELTGILGRDAQNQKNTNWGTIENALNNLQGQISQLVVHGDSSPQAAQASVGEDGTNYGGNLKARLDAEYNKISDSIALVETHLSYIGKDVKKAGAKGDWVSTSSIGTDDTLIIQSVFDQAGIIFIPDGKYRITSPIKVKSYTRVIFSPKAEFHTYTDKAFLFESGVEQIRMEQPRLYDHSIGTPYAFYMDGNTSNGYTTSVKNVVINQGYAEGYTWSFYLNSMRKSTITNFYGWTRNGIQYVGKSAENVFDNSNFINYDESGSGKGFYSIANADGYPEGISINNTLFYHYERNFHIRDLYSGHFKNMYLDGGATTSLDNLLEYGSRTQFLNFDDTWLLKKGIVIGETNYSTPKEFRTKFTNTVFDSLINEGFHINTWARELEFNNTTIFGDGTMNAIGIVGVGQNNFLKINGYRGRFMESNVQIKGNGQFVELWNVSNFDSLAPALHIYNEQTISVNGQTVTP